MAFTAAPRDAELASKIVATVRDATTKARAIEVASSYLGPTHYPLLENNVARIVGKQNWITYFQGTFGPQSF